MEKEASYKKHRRRMKDKFIVSGFAGMAEHEILEFMLYFALPRIDTKPIAKRLIVKFGSLENVLAADVCDLQHIEGLGEHSAIFLKSLDELYGYLGRKVLKERTVLDTPEKAGKYISKFFNNMKHEVMLAFFLDKGNRLIKWKTLEEGGVDSITVNTADIVREAAVSHATGVIIAHNHPGGHHGPSGDDSDTTKTIAKALQVIHVKLRDHIIVADGGYSSFMELGML